MGMKVSDTYTRWVFDVNAVGRRYCYHANRAFAKSARSQTKKLKCARAWIGGRSCAFEAVENAAADVPVNLLCGVVCTTVGSDGLRRPKYISYWRAEVKVRKLSPLSGKKRDRLQTHNAGFD